MVWDITILVHNFGFRCINSCCLLPGDGEQCFIQTAVFCFRVSAMKKNHALLFCPWRECFLYKSTKWDFSASKTFWGKDFLWCFIEQIRASSCLVACCRLSLVDVTVMFGDGLSYFWHEDPHTIVDWSGFEIALMWCCQTFQDILFLVSTILQRSVNEIASKICLVFSGFRRKSTQCKD